MKRVIGLVIVFCAASFVSGAPCATAAAPAAKMTAAQRAAAKAAAAAAAVLLLAPADEYFGPLKQSVVGIRNEIRVLGWNYDVNHDIAAQTVASALLTERAIRDWAKKYPRDDQVPKALFLLQRLYTKVLSLDARNHAHVIAQWLLGSYAKSPQAKQLHKVLAVEHLAPLAAASPVATPLAAYQSIFGSQYPSAFTAAGQMAPVPAPSPSSHP